MTKSIALNSTLAMVAAVAMVFATVSPAFAAINSTAITLNITNRGSITNTTSADSHTGQNFAFGSLGGSGGTGGNVDGGQGNENNGGATAGNGGNGGNGGAGGLVQTGNATSEAGSENGLNGTDAEIDLGTCGCGDINSVTIEATIDNDRESPLQNDINNTTRADARTGQNLALGSAGGTGGGAGDVTSEGSENNGGATSGNGGSGGAGGLGGTIGTGNASSTSGSVNLLNTTFVRVRM